MTAKPFPEPGRNYYGLNMTIRVENNIFTLMKSEKWK